MLALDMFGPTITELDMEYYYWLYQKETVAYPLLSISAFDISSPHSRSLSNILSRLRKLHLALDLTANALEDLYEDVFLEGHAAMALSQASNLESLYIEPLKVTMTQVKKVPFSLSWEAIVSRSLRHLC